MSKIINNFGGDFNTGIINDNVVNSKLMFDGVNERVNTSINEVYFNDGLTDFDYSLYCDFELLAKGTLEHFFLARARSTIVIGQWTLGLFGANGLRAYHTTVGGNFRRFTANSTLDLNTRYKLIFNYNSTTDIGEFWLNGTLIAATKVGIVNVSPANLTTSITIGSNFTGGAGIPNSYIYQVGVFNKQLDTSEVKKIQNNVNINTLEGLIYANNFSKNINWGGTNFLLQPTTSPTFEIGNTINMEQTDLQ